MAQAATAATAFFLSAHEDDWQLFMGHQAYSDLHLGGARTVLVHVTAGDAGQGVSTRYFLAREEGALRALRFIKGTASRGQANLSSSEVTVAGRKLLRYASPDGRAVA